jgi:alkylhydroperoxidase/carboxymuconolactone decarboxylase family protein YurZ
MTDDRSPGPRHLDSLDAAISDRVDVGALRAASPSTHDTASEFWRVPVGESTLSPRVTELVLVGMHASVTTLNVDATERHIKRALEAGATKEEVLDVLMTIVGVANHALYFSVPVLEEELRAAGHSDDSPSLADDDEFATTKAEFIATRGFWNPDRERLARLMPQYFAAINDVATDSWKNGPLSGKERELVCIGVDCTVNHNYEPGLRRHIRNALGYGATRDEILAVFQLAGLVGLETYILGARTLFGIDRLGCLTAVEPAGGALTGENSA